MRVFFSFIQLYLSMNKMQFVQIIKINSIKIIQFKQQIQNLIQTMQIGNRDLDKIDPDWRFAYFHAKSTRPGNCSQDRPQICQCCLNIVHKQPIPIGVHAKDLQFLGFGFPLWYAFLKNCLILLLILIVSQSCVSVYEAIQMNKQFCHEQYNKFASSPTSIPSSPHTSHLSNILVNRNFNHLSNSFNNIQVHNKIDNYNHREKSSLQSSASAHGDKKLNQGGHEDSGHSNEEGHGEDHHSPHCTGIFILLSRIDKHIDDLQVVMRCTTFIIIMLTLIYIRDTIYKTQQYYDERRCSMSDYSLIISKLPKTHGVQGLIRQFFYEGFSEPYVVQEMILIPQLEQLEEIQEQKSHQLKMIQKYYKNGQKQHQHEINELEKKIEQLEVKQNHEVEVFREQLEHDKLPSQRIIVVVGTQPQKQKILEEFDEMQKQSLIKYFGQQGVEVDIQEAPQPREIVWENINYPSSKRFGRIVLGWALSIGFIAVVTLIFYFILRWKTHVVEEQQSVTLATVIVFTALVLVILFNKFVMGNVLHHFTHLEKHATSDRYQFSFAFKYSLGMFFTTALMTLFVEAITYGNFYTHHYGVIQQQSIMFFMNSFLVPIIWAINPFQLMILIKRKLHFGDKYLTQRQANTLMEDFSYDVGKRYAQILETMWFTFLYVALIPMGSFLTVIGIALYYWVDKYNLLRRSSIHENVSGKLSIIALKLLDLCLVFMPLGQIIFDHFLRHEVKIPSIVCLVIGIIYLCLPINDIIDYFNRESFNLEQKHYRDVKHTFKDNYFNLHPMYSKTHEDQNSQSRKLFKDSVLKQFGNPIFSFAHGWLAKNLGKNNTNIAQPTSSNPIEQMSKIGSTNMRSTKDQSGIYSGNPGNNNTNSLGYVPNSQPTIGF